MTLGPTAQIGLLRLQSAVMLLAVLATPLYAAGAPEVWLDFLRLGQSKAQFDAVVAGYRVIESGLDGGKRDPRTRGFIISSADKPNEMVAVANFCDDRLILVHAERKPTVPTFVRIVAELKTKFGEPLMISTAPARIVGKYTADSITLSWRTPFGQADVTFSEIDGGGQLYVSYSLRNSCFKNAFGE